MVFKVIIKGKKRTLVSDHRLKSAALKFKSKINRARKKGKFPSVKSVRLIKIKKK